MKLMFDRYDAFYYSGSRSTFPLARNSVYTLILVLNQVPRIQSIGFGRVLVRQDGLGSSVSMWWCYSHHEMIPHCLCYGSYVTRMISHRLE